MLLDAASDKPASTYEDIWRWLNRSDLEPIPTHLVQDHSNLTFAATLEHFQRNTHAKVIDLRGLTGADEIYLASKGILPRYLLRNLKKAIPGRDLGATAFQLNAVRTKCIHAICPVSGKVIQSNHSLLANINTIFYRFTGPVVFYIAIAGIGQGFKKSAVYFPEYELIVTSGQSWSFEEDDLIELKARVVSNASACYDYLSGHNKDGKKTAVCLGFYHFAHHLWNELSGIQRLHKNRLLKGVDKFLVLREPLGELEQIFPEIAKDRVERRSDTEDLFKGILTCNYFVVRVGDTHISSDLAARVYQVALKNCLPATLDAVRGAKRHSPLLWVGIRVGSRMWADQIDGLANVINSLHTEFPGLGVVFDGFSLPADRLTQSSGQEDVAEIISKERAVVDNVIERLQEHPQGTPGVFNIIGGSIFDANVWAHAIDVYVAPYGSLQHKVGWLANKPGIIHTNKTLLENAADYIWLAAEDAIRPRYVRCACVRDVRSMEKERIMYNELSDAREIGAGVLAMNRRVRGNPVFNNYVIEWKCLYDDLLDLIRCPKVSLKLALRRQASASKRKLRNILESVASRLDPDKPPEI